MKPLKGTIDGIEIDIPMPEPEELVKNGVWYEIVKFGLPKNKTYFFNTINLSIYQASYDWNGKDGAVDCRLLLAQIPKPTQDQLGKINLELDGDRPMECKENDFVWIDEVINEEISKGSHRIGSKYSGCHHFGKLRWHLKPKEHKEKHYGCYGCAHSPSSDPTDNVCCLRWKECTDESEMKGWRYLRRFWTPTQKPRLVDNFMSLPKECNSCVKGYPMSDCITCIRNPANKGKA
jgi:hypothetical protein